MEIKLLTNGHIIKDTVYGAGQIIEVDEGKARRLIKQGHAERFEAEPVLIVGTDGCIKEVSSFLGAQMVETNNAQYLEDVEYAAKREHNIDDATLKKLRQEGNFADALLAHVEEIEAAAVQPKKETATRKRRTRKKAVRKNATNSKS